MCLFAHGRPVRKPQPGGDRRWLAGVREHAGDTSASSSQFWFSVAELLLCAMWHLRAAGLLTSICINGEVDPSPVSHSYIVTPSNLLPPPPYRITYLHHWQFDRQQQAALWLRRICRIKPLCFVRLLIYLQTGLSMTYIRREWGKPSVKH